MLLPGTYNAVACRYLVGSWSAPAPTDRASLAAFLSSHQQEDGAFRVPGMSAETLTYPDFEYDDLHVTNYALGALDLLGQKPARHLAFAEQYADLDRLEAWLTRRDLDAPWTEGNHFVNVGSVLAWLAEEGHASAPRAFLRLLEWHDENQDPATGFWTNPGVDPVSGMAGAAHDLHLYYLAGRPVPRYGRIVDTCLGLLRGAATTACLDVDAVDILANLHAYGHRTADIEAYLEEKLCGILAVQNPDGGFPDAFEGERTFDGWESYREPQGISNAFATWFRMAAVAMAAAVLHPETRPRWRFRRTIGIGYFPQVPAGRDRSPAWLERVIGDGSTRSGRRTMVPARPPSPGPVPASTLKAGPRAVAEALVARITAASPASRARAAGRCRFDLGVDGVLEVEIDEKGVREVAAGASTTPGLTLRLSTSDLELVLAGRLGATAAYLRKRLRIQGDVSRAMALQAMLKAR